MTKKETFKSLMDWMIDIGHEAIFHCDPSFTPNICFIGNEAAIEKQLFQYCQENNVPLKVVDVLEEVNHKTNQLDLFDELQNKAAILYLKNYTKTRPKVRYRFSTIYKDQCAVNENGFVKKHDLKYLGTVIIMDEKVEHFSLDSSELSCFRHTRV